MRAAPVCHNHPAPDTLRSLNCPKPLYMLPLVAGHVGMESFGHTFRPRFRLHVVL